MPTTLSQEIHNEVFAAIRRSFGSDFAEFDILVSDKLKQAIKDSNDIEITASSIKKVTERYFDASIFRSPEHKALFSQISLVFKAAYCLLLSYHDYPRSLMWSTTDQLLTEYPQFEDADPLEQQYLLNFRNLVKVSLLVIPARLNKEKILKIAGRLEGSQSPDYITGGGQKKEVHRRVQIYEREGGVSARKRAERKRKASISSCDSFDGSHPGETSASDSPSPLASDSRSPMWYGETSSANKSGNYASSSFQRPPSELSHGHSNNSCDAFPGHSFGEWNDLCPIAQLRRSCRCDPALFLVPVYETDDRDSEILYLATWCSYRYDFTILWYC